MHLRRRDDASLNAPPAVELAGYLDAAVGVGEAARRYLEALRVANVPVLERAVPLPGRGAAMCNPVPDLRPDPDDISVNLLCLNPEQMMPYLRGSDAPPRTGRKAVAIWSWEVDVVPPGWRDAAAEVAQVWTYSHFSAHLMSKALGITVTAVPPPVAALTTLAPLPLALPDGFRVLVMFDYLSTLERKNPGGAIEAYCKAFQADEGACLIVKSVNGEHRPERSRELTKLAGGRHDVVFVDRVMSSGERDALVAECDCHLSLHRSEGHGLVLAEAMVCGKPVIATAYGGNTEFMNEQNAYPVAWRSGSVGPGVEHYPSGALWAEPDAEHAARLLRTVREGGESVQRRVRRAQADIEAKLSPATVGTQMRVRLEALTASPSSRRS